MIAKHPICRDRVRHVPRQFSWVDHRLVRDRHIESLTHPAAALYLFLLTVADYQGLSFYSDPAIMQEKPQVAAFIYFYLNNVGNEITDVGYFPVSDARMQQNLDAFSAAVGQ